MPERLAPSISPLISTCVSPGARDAGARDDTAFLIWQVPEMLVPGMISSLRVHPNQRFKVSVEALPSFRMYQPGATVHGQVFPTGRQAALLREDYGEVPH